jgi:hypothetical protein
MGASRADEPVVRTFDLSPDGHALAFAATGRGTSQLSVFVTTYPDLRQRREVAAGGAAPRFSRDGRELFYLRGGRTAKGSPAASGPSRFKRSTRRRTGGC